MNLFSLLATMLNTNTESENNISVLILISILILLSLIYFLIKNKNKQSRGRNKNIKRKAYISLSPKQSFQILEYNFKEYMLIVSSDKTVLIDKNELKNHKLGLINKGSCGVANG